MRGSSEEQFPEHLQRIAARLTEQRVDPDPLKLDRLKQRALSQSMAGNGRPSSIRSWLAAALSGLVLVIGSGGALAVSHVDSHPNTHGGAADEQYKPGKGCGGKKHQHKRHGACKKQGAKRHGARKKHGGKRHGACKKHGGKRHGACKKHGGKRHGACKKHGG